MPALIVSLFMGEMGQEFILASRRIQPAKLLAAAYAFRFPDLASAVRYEQERMQAELASEAANQHPTIQV